MGKQEQEMLETRRAQYLPLVIPMSGPPTRSPAPGGEYFDEYFDAEMPLTPPQDYFILRNIGPGLALNVWLIIFGPPTEYHAHLLAPRRAAVLTVPLPPNETGEARTQGTLAVRGTMSIDGNPEHILYAPPTPTVADMAFRDISAVLARFTITYHDIFGLKHASQFDFTRQHRWRCVGFFPDIPKDLHELHREQYTANMGGAATDGGTQEE
jgi:hypothetical protein